MTKAQGARLFIFCVVLIGCYMVACGNSAPLLLFQRILGPLRALLPFPLVFFIPGIFWTAAFLRRSEGGALELLLANVGISAALLIGTTTALKLCNIGINRANLLILISLCFLGGFIAFALREKRPLQRNTLSRYWIHLILLAMALGLLRIVFVEYFTWGQDRHWVAVGNPINPIDRKQRLTAWHFPASGDSAKATRTLQAGAIEIDQRRWRAIGDTVTLSILNENYAPQAYALAMFFQSKRPLTISVYHNGTLIDQRPIDKLIDVRCEHVIPLAYRLAWNRLITLTPGENKIELRLSGQDVRGAGLLIDDFSNLSKPQFLTLASQRYLFGEIGALYDNLEVLDLSRHLREKCFTYTDDLRAGLPGYTIAIPPLDFYLNMFFLVLGKNDLTDVRYFYIAKLAILYLVFLLFYNMDRKNGSSLFILLPLFVILAESVNLVNFRLAVGQDTSLCIWFLLAAYFLATKSDGLFLLFAIFTCLTRNHGVLFVLLTMLSYKIFYGSNKGRLLRLGGYLSSFGIAYCALALFIGYKTGVLKTIWLKDFIDENYRFRFNFAQAAGGPMIGAAQFIGWLCVTSCFQFILVALKKDRLSKYLLCITGIYFFLLLFAKTYKPYYLIMIVYPLSLIGARNLLQCDTACVRIHFRGRTLGRFNLSKALFAMMILLGVASIVSLSVSPLLYPELTTGFPSLHFMLNPANP